MGLLLLLVKALTRKRKFQGEGLSPGSYIGLGISVRRVLF